MGSNINRWTEAEDEILRQRWASAFGFELFGRGLKSLSWFQKTLAYLRRPLLALAIDLAYVIRRRAPQNADGISAITFGCVMLALSILSGLICARLLGFFSPA